MHNSALVPKADESPKGRTSLRLWAAVRVEFSFKVRDNNVPLEVETALDFIRPNISV